MSSGIRPTVLAAGSVRRDGGGPAIYYLSACVAGGLALVLRMVVMRGLLKPAIADRTELDEVI